MKHSRGYVGRTNDPLDQELARRLNRWDEEREADWRQSMRPQWVELGWWVAVALGVAAATVHWLV